MKKLDIVDLFGNKETVNLKNDNKRTIINSVDKITDVQSIGLGVQSSMMAIMSGLDMMPRADYYFWSKLRETPDTFEYAEYLIPKLKSLGVNLQVLEPSDIYEHIMSWDIEDRVSMIPVWFMGADGKRQPLNRQCTSDFKIQVVASAVRENLGVKQLKRHSVRVWQGISMDEIKRATKTALWPMKGLTYRINHFPFIPQYANLTHESHKWQPYTRQDLIDLCKKLGFKVPPKSACFFCPFHDIEYWYNIFINFPKEWELSCMLDDSIRNYNSKNDSLVSGPFYLYEGLIALREIDFDKELNKFKTGQYKLTGCDTGFCFV